ncbi:hypothetical protein [Streptomyces sp. NPDC008141]
MEIAVERSARGGTGAVDPSAWPALPRVDASSAISPRPVPLTTAAPLD